MDSKPLIPSRTDKELSELVRRALAGELFFGCQIRTKNDIPAVFLPLAFGISFGEKPEELRSPPPAPPVPPPPLEPLAELKGDEEKDLEGPRQSLREAEWALEEARRFHEWGTVAYEEVERALTRVEEARSHLQVAEQSYENSLSRERQKRAQEWEEKRAARERELLLYEAEIVARRERDEARARIEEAWEGEQRALREQFCLELGEVYGEMQYALPRGINGNPMFDRCAFLNKADWERVRAAILREREREIKV